MLFGLVLLLIPMISAISDDLVYRQWSEVDLKVPCFNNNTFCSAAAICNITILYPDATVLVDNELMTNQYSYHNYTLNTTRTSESGIYATTVICTDNGYYGYSTFQYEITGSGYLETTNFYWLILALTASVITLGFFIKDGWVTILGTFGLYFLGIYILLNGIVGIRDLITTRAIGMITLAVAMYISVRSAHEMISGGE